MLDDLNEAQREAVEATSGPLVILAGAGTGKTRVISRRAAHAIETGVVSANKVLLVTFTDKAATEMVERMSALGHQNVMARTFHSHAVRQLRHFWPSRHDGQDPPQILDSKLPLIGPLARNLPGHYRFTPTKDIADAIEWAKVRRIPPAQWEQSSEAQDKAPIPADLFARIYAGYERAKERAKRVDFEDMLALTVQLLEEDEEARSLVQTQKTWISVDEYQDTNPLQERLLELWLGDSRDIAVVGDPDQTIYTFTGATPDYLLRFAQKHAGAKTIALTQNYRSTPQVLAFANRLTAGGPRGALTTDLPVGPEPTIDRFAGPEVELAAVVAGIKRLIGAGIKESEIAVLVRINAQLPPVEDELTRAGIAYTVRGQRFYQRNEVREAQLLRRTEIAATGAALVTAVRDLFKKRLGYEADAETVGEDARERAASLDLLLTIAADLVEANADAGVADLTAELDRRDTAEAAAQGQGVNLLTYHRAKGLEWDAVFLPQVEEGTLPIRQAKTDEEVAEERRLLYVGITRARTHLALSWSRKPSRFLAEIRPQSVRVIPSVGGPAPRADSSNTGLLEALQLWRRERAKRDGMPAYVIAHDATLHDIAETKPTTIAGLRRIKGMGPVKLDQYGAEILAVIAKSSS